MRPIFPLLLIIVFVAGCRKGKDDPLLSLQSRKARLSGAWELKEGHCELELSYKAKRETQSFTLSKSIFYIEGIDTSNAPYSGSGNYSLKLDFDKEGNFSLHEIIGQIEMKGAGKWDFSARQKSSRSKEHLVLVLESVDKGNSGMFTIFALGNTEFYYSIRELRKDKLVLTGRGSRLQSAGGYNLVFETELVFEEAGSPSK